MLSTRLKIITSETKYNTITYTKKNNVSVDGNDANDSIAVGNLTYHKTRVILIIIIYTFVCYSSVARGFCVGVV